MLLKDAECACFPEKTAKLIFWVFLSFFINTSAQAILNNFGNLETIKTYSGCKKIVLLDYNNDGYNDVFLCGNNKKFFVLHQNLSDSTFSKPIKKFFFYPIDDIKWLNKTPNGEDYYLFISHNKRLIGLVSFTKYFSLQLLSTIEFNSYPSSIRIVDLNNDGMNEALIFGNNFDGLALVKNKAYKLYATKLIQQMVVKDLDLIDFNQDNFKDIVLIDMLNNSLKFYENYAKDKIIFNREIEFREPIRNIRKIDFNYDEFEDLLLGKDNGFEVLFGDSVYAFYQRKKTDYDYAPESFELKDINSDLKDEVVSFDTLNNQVVVSFTDSLENNTNKYFMKGLTDYKILEDSTGKKLIQLSNTGNLFIISDKNQKGRNFNFTIGGKPTLIKIKNDDKTQTRNFSVYDSFEKNINLFQLDSLGNFIKNIKIHLFNPVSDFIINSNKKIIAFKKNSRLLEVVTKKTNSNNYNHNFIYSAKPVQKVKFKNNSLFDVMELENGVLFLQTFLYEKNKYITQKLTMIDSSVIQADFNNGRGILYWKQTKGKLSLFKSDKNKSKNLVNINIKDTLNVNARFIYNTNYSFLYTIVQYDKHTLVYSIKNNGLKKIEIESDDVIGKIINENDFKLAFNKQTKTTSLFYLNRKKNKLYEFTMDEKSNIFSKKSETSVQDVGNFYVDKIFGKMYFVYTNLKNYSISFRALE